MGFTRLASTLGGRVTVSKTWAIRPMYASARDTQTWLKVRHRNIYVAAKDAALVDQDCLACRNHRENLLHFARCSEIMDSFWDEILATMRATSIPCDRTNAFIILG